MAAATHGQAELMVPIKSTLVGEDESSIPGVYPGCVLEERQAPLLWRFTGEGTGRVSHLGRVTYEFAHCLHVDFTIAQGVVTLQAANGDTLVLSYTGDVTQYVPGDPDAFWEMSWTPSSGTGRFTTASGSGGAGFGVTYTATSPLAGTTDLTIQGMPAYDASNRAAR